jgi:hypothetical protein
LTCYSYSFWFYKYLRRDNRINYDGISTTKTDWNSLFFGSVYACIVDLYRKQTLTQKLPYTIIVQTRTILILIVACPDICLYSSYWTFLLISLVFFSFSCFLMMMSAIWCWCILTNSRWLDIMFLYIQQNKQTGKCHDHRKHWWSRQERLKQTMLIEHLSWLTSNEKRSLDEKYRRGTFLRETLVMAHIHTTKRSRHKCLPPGEWNEQKIWLSIFIVWQQSF